MSNSEAPTSVEHIWSDDLFGRRAEAEQIIAYLESVASRPNSRGDAHAFSFAIDANYGIGKTFFLRRLKEHLSLNHPVAFVDAWVDDLSDEPLTALSATLRDALNPLMGAGPKIKSAWKLVAKRVGRITQITLGGLTRRAVSFAISAPAVDAIDAVLNETSDSIKNLGSDAASDSGKQIVDHSAKAVTAPAPDELLNARIKSFQEGRRAITELKSSLRDLVEAVRQSEKLHPPIFILIDELDRCRPTYAIKLLEEIKHLFDVQGLIFIFGMHGDQLARAVNGAYGATFDGNAYLHRFIDRRFTLSEPALEPLVTKLLAASAIDQNRLRFTSVASLDGRIHLEGASALISTYLQAFGVSPRQTFHIVDKLETCAALTGSAPLIMPYLLPVLIANAEGKHVSELKQRKFDFGCAFYPAGRSIEVIHFSQFADMITQALSSSGGDHDFDTPRGLAGYMVQEAKSSRIKIAFLQNYSELMNSVGRFSSTIVT